jgi:hypothetical protein
MPRSEAIRTLGLKNATLVRVAAAGAMRYVAGPEQNFPYGFFFLREDVMRIKQALEKHRVPLTDYSGPCELISLRHAMKNYLGSDSGPAAVLLAVIEGRLEPVGFTNRFRGITGYLFRSKELRKYRPVPERKFKPEVFLNFSEAAVVLGVRSYVVRGLVEKGLLSIAGGYRNGFSKLIPEKEIRGFAECYVAASVLAKRLKLSGRSFARHLRQTGTPVLAVPISDEGKGDALFLRTDIASKVRIMTRRRALFRGAAVHPKRYCGGPR